METERFPGSNNIFHYAKIRDSEQLAAALANGVEVNRIDGGSGSNALHFLYSEVCLSEECQLEVAKCTKLLLNHGISLNLPNKAGDVPLYLALRNEWNKSARLLVLNGADLTIKLKSKELLATYLANAQPDILYELLDQDVSVDEEKDDMLRVDFRNILQYYDLRGKNLTALMEMNANAKNFDETAFLHSISHVVRNTKVFEHPLLLLFLDLKYRKLQPVILVSFFWHAAIVLLYTCYVYFVYVDVCPFDKYNMEKVDDNEPTEPTILEEEELTCKISVFLKVISGILTALWASMMLTEVQIWWYRARTAYFTKRTLPWFVFYVLTPLTLWPSLGSSDDYILKWRYPVAAFNVFLIWTLCLEQFSKIQQLAVLYDMFLSIALKIFKLTCLFIPLFVGFTIAFFIMDAEGIDNWYSLITVISMMIGDLSYDDLFDESKQRESSEVYEIFANALYLLFILFMSVVFINYILAVTISDINELYSHCEKSQIKNKIQLMYIFDRLKLTRLEVIPANLIRQGRFEYILNVNHPPSLVDQDVVEKLRQLAVKRGCRHDRIGKGITGINGSSPSKAVAVGSLSFASNALSSAASVTLNSEEGRIIYEALRILETKLNINK